MPKQTRWILPLMAMTFAALPWVFGLAIKPPDNSYLASYVRAPGDTTVYYRYINEGRSGGPFMIDGFTTEAHPAILWQPLWWLIGRGAELLQLSTPLVFALARVILSGLLALTIVWAAAKCFSDGRTRVAAAWLGYFGAGLGGLLLVIWPGFASRAGPPVYDLWVSEGYPWMSSLASPHFLLVTIGLLFIVVGVEYAWRDRWVRWLAGPVLLLVTSIHPFHIFTIGLTWLGLSAIEVFTHSTEWGNRLRRRFFVGLWVVPAIVYYLIIAQEPIIRGRAFQNVNPTYPWMMFLGIAPLLVMAILTIVRRRQLVGVMVAWAAAITVAVFLPVVFQRRFFHPASLVLAFIAAPLVAEWLGRGRWWRWVAVLSFTVMIFSPGVVAQQNMKFAWDNAQSSRHTFSYTTPAFVGVQTQLQRHPEWSPVLTGRLNGNLLAATPPIRPYIAHGVETLAFSTKYAEVEAFFGSMTSVQQADFLRQNRICSILTTPYEETYGRDFTACPLTKCRPVYQAPEVTLWATGLCP